MRDRSGRPLLEARCAGAVDTVGGEVLATILKTTSYRGALTCCGLVNSAELHTPVFPFILRSVSLLGVDSQNTPHELRKRTWAKPAGNRRLRLFDSIASEIQLNQVDEHIQRLLKGQFRGRVPVDLQA